MDADSLYLDLSAAVRAAEDKMGVRFVGVSFLTFCPICGFRPKISKSASASLKGYLDWVFQNFGGVASFVPCDLAAFERFRRRALFYPICRECWAKHRAGEILEVAERNLLHLSRVWISTIVKW